MRKTRSEARWNELSPEQIEMLDNWLFEQKLSHAKAWARAQKQFGFKGSVSSVKRYFLRRQKERMITDLTELKVDVAKVEASGVEPQKVHKANMTVINGVLFRALSAAPEKVKEWAPVAQLAVQNNHDDTLRKIKDEEHKIRLQGMEFAKEKFHIEVMEKALAALPQLKQLAEAKKDPNTKRYEENAHWNRVRQAMFGMGIKVHPESAEEEMQMLAAKRERDAKEGREPNPAEQKIINSQPPVPVSPHYEEYLAAKAKSVQIVAGGEEDEPAVEEPGNSGDERQ
jgi:hypothetical protein